jgi:peptide deformylase
MIRPIVVYGDAVLRKMAEPIDKSYPQISELIRDMFDTLAHAEGVGLAAPQVGLPIRLFIVDLSILGDDEPSFADFKKVMINPLITSFEGELLAQEEGCLSIPGISETVKRSDKITIEYYDENWQKHIEEYSGFPSRVMQHEYDHIEGHVFVDKISPIRRQMISSKLTALTKGKFSCHYKVKKN